TPLVRLEMAALVLGDPGYAKAWNERAARVAEDLEQLASYAQSARETNQLAAARSAFERYRGVVIAEQELLRRGEKARALALTDAEARTLAEEVQESLDGLMAAIHTRVLAAQAEAARLEARTWTGVLIALGAAVGLALLVALENARLHARGRRRGHPGSRGRRPGPRPAEEHHGDGGGEGAAPGDHRRPDARAADDLQLAEQRDQVHRSGRSRHRDGRYSLPGRPQRLVLATDQSRGHRDRHQGGRPGPHLREVRAGRCLARPRAGGNRARPRPDAQARRASRRPDRRGERRHQGPGQRVHGPPAARAPRNAARELTRPALRSGVRRRRVQPCVHLVHVGAVEASDSIGWCQPRRL